jgi:hypothetical protein
MMIESRYPAKLIFTLLAIFSVRFVFSSFLLQLLCTIIFIFWIFERLKEKKKAVDILTGSVFLFEFVRLISIILSEYPILSYESLYKEGLFYLTAISLPFYLKTIEKNKLLDLLLIFILGAIVMSLVGIVKFTIGDVERAQGFSSGYSAFSSYLIVALGLVLFFPVKHYTSKYLFHRLIAIFILTAGVVTSLGRMNIAIAVLMILTAIIFSRFNLKQIVIIGSLSAVNGYCLFFISNCWNYSKSRKYNKLLRS